MVLTIHLSIYHSFRLSPHLEVYHTKIGSDGIISLLDVLQPGLPKKHKTYKWPPLAGKGFSCVYSVKSPPIVKPSYYSPGLDDDYNDPCRTSNGFLREQHVQHQSKVSSGVFHDSSHASFVDMCVFLALITKHKQARPIGEYPDAWVDLAKALHCPPLEELVNTRINIVDSFYPPMRHTPCPKREEDELYE